MATLPKKMTAVFQKYEKMNPNSWKMGDFERDIIEISRQPANYQNAKSAIFIDGSAVFNVSLKLPLINCIFLRPIN